MHTNIGEFCYLIDEFYKEFYKAMEEHVREKENGKKHRNRHFTMSDSEVITILVLFHLKRFRDLETFYTCYIQVYCKKDFPKTVSCNRFVELQQKVIVPMTVFLQTCCLGKCSGISFIDSTPLRVYHIKREHARKTFRGMATKGKSTIGWFFGFKLPIVIKDNGEILDFVVTRSNVDDRVPLKGKRFHEKVPGKLFADRGCISQDLFEELLVDGIHLVTRIKKNMKNVLMPLVDKIYLRKRALVESVNDELKNVCQVEHTRHRCFENFIGNRIAALIAYNFLLKKPSLNLKIIDMTDVQRFA
jgi:hypothetical protein